VGKLIEAGKVITFDFDAPSLFIQRGDRLWLRRNPDWRQEKPEESVNDSLVTARAVRMVVGEIVQAAYPQGMSRVDGKIWAAWLEVLDDDAETKTQLPLAAIQWLQKRAEDDGVKLRPGLVQWREAVVDYLNECQKTDAEPDKPSQ
jgi:hypothetical protein